MRISCRLATFAVLQLVTSTGVVSAITLAPSINFQTQGSSTSATGGQSSGSTLNFRLSTTTPTNHRFGMEFPLAAVPASNVVAGVTWRGTPTAVTGSSQLDLHGYVGNGLFSPTDTYNEDNLMGQAAGFAAGSEISVEFDPGYFSTLIGSASYFGMYARERTTGVTGTFASRTTATPPKLEVALVDPMALNSNRWIASGTQNWSVGGNWSLGTPFFSDDIFIRPTLPSVVLAPIGHQEAKTLSLGGGGSAQAELVIGDGAEFVSNGTTTLGPGGILRLGNGTYQSAGLNTAPGGTIDWGTNGYLAIDGGYLSTPVGDFIVDGADTPILVMIGGKMRKSTTTDTATDRLVIADDESAFLFVGGQSDVRARIVRVGNQPTGFGRIQVAEAGTLFQPTALLEIGPLGRGEVTVSHQSRFEAGLIFVGATLQGAMDNDDVDRLTISDPGTTAKVASIDADGRSIVEIRNGAVVEASGVGGAGDPTQPSIFRVSDPGTRLTITDRIQTGSTLTTNGSIQFFVENGARIDTKNFLLSIGSAMTGMSRSAMTITGAGSQVNTTSNVILGGFRDSESTLDVLDGGVFRAGAMTALSYSIAPVPLNTVSNVRVSGNGSRWEQTGEIHIGGARDLNNNLVDLGVATMTVENAATLTATTAINVLQHGTLNFTAGLIEAPILRNNRGGIFNFTGGTLAVGQFDGNLVQQGGTVAAGASPGVMTINGDYTLEENGVLELELAAHTTPGAGYDLYTVSGDATLGGKLRVALLNGFAPTLGDSFAFLTAQGDLTSTFDELQLPNLSAGLAWQLYSSEHTVFLDVVSNVQTGDYNHNGVVDAADYTVWRNALGRTGTGLAADGDGDHAVDLGDYSVWRSRFGRPSGGGGAAAFGNGSVPEPTAVCLCVMSAISFWPRLRRQRIFLPQLLK